MRKLKKGLVFVLALAMCFSCLGGIMAGARYALIESVIGGLDYKGNTAYCAAGVSGNSKVTSITATVTLQKVESNGTYTTVKLWSGLSASGNEFDWSDTATIQSGATYRLKLVAVAHSSSGSETTTEYVTK